MKKRKYENSVSFPAWFTILLIALLSLTVRCIVHLLPFNEVVISIISDLSVAILSVAILDFFLTISSEQKLVSSIVDSIQYKITKNEDFCGLSIDEKAEIIRKIYLSSFKSAIPETKAWYPNYINQYCQTLSHDFLHVISTSKYYSDYTRRVDIVLRDQDIKINIGYKLTICNPALEECIYKHDPMFGTQKEFDSYQIIHLSIDDEEIRPNLSSEMKTAYTNPLYYSGRKIEYDLSHKSKTIIVQKVSYETDYNQFFQTYWLHYPCENFRLEASVIDQRSKKDTIYTLHWELFGPLDRSRIAKDNMKQTEFHISTDTIKNLPQGSGFILCLNSKK